MSSSIIKLENNSFSRFIPLLIGFMVFLSVLFISVAHIVDEIGSKWTDGINNSMTVQIIPDVNLDSEQNDDIISRTITILNQHYGVQDVNLMPNDKVIEMLLPWFGGGLRNVEFPIPRIIDVKLIDNLQIDTVSLKAQLGQISDSIIVDDFSDWRDRVNSIVNTINGLVYTIVLLIIVSCMIISVTLTRALMLMNVKTLNMLMLMGAMDSFIAKEFVSYALSVVIKSSLYGFFVALLSINSILYFNNFDFELHFYNWLLIFGVIPVVVILSFLVSIITVKLTLIKRFFNIEF